jgi:protein-S-isoprenylcysteine O-methyltransferase Ste14
MKVHLTVLVANLALVAIRAPHGQRSRSVPVVASRRGAVERALLAFAFATFFVPFVWLLTPWLSSADYPLHPLAFGLGVEFLIVGLWLFHRAHTDLGTNWSLSLEVRANHRLVTDGVYRKVRHPMYTSLLFFSIGEALVLPNFLAGPAYLVAMLVMIAFRLPSEERLMFDTFGAEYEAYRSRTKRLMPGVW